MDATARRRQDAAGERRRSRPAAASEAAGRPRENRRMRVKRGRPGGAASSGHGGPGRGTSCAGVHDATCDCNRGDDVDAREPHAGFRSKTA